MREEIALTARAPVPSAVAGTDAREDGDGGLRDRLENLKDVTYTLLQEVRSLSHVPASEIKRGIDFYEEVQRFEVDLIRRTLDITGGHQGRACRLLGLKITTLNSMLKRYSISPDDYSPRRRAAAAPGAPDVAAHDDLPENRIPNLAEGENAQS